MKKPWKKNIKFKKIRLIRANQKLNKQYKADFVCYDAKVLEINAVLQIPVVFNAQLKNYLKCTKMELGMLINFGTPSLTYKRILNSKKFRLTHNNSD